MKIFIYFLVLCSLTLTTKAQTIYDTLDDPSKNYYDLVNYYTEYFKTHETGKGTGYKMFKRWEAETKYWIDEKGNRIDPSHYKAELNKFNSGSVNKTSSASCVANWTELGPTYWNHTSSWAPGLGRVDAVAIHPLNTNIIYAGSPEGGCWKTSNGGTNWTSLTDGQVFMKIGDVEVDPTNLNRVYIGTLGSGMLISNDGGVTLNQSNTGLPANVNIRKIIVDPTNTANVLVATTSGIYRSTNSGANWAQSIAGSFLDLDFKPGNSSVVYACGTNFYRSTNGGANFTQITSGITASGIMRLAVSPADPNLVCIVQCAGSVFGKFYKSTDGGTNFITTVTGNSANGTNFFGYSPAGTDNSGQGGYNIDVTISPTNANEIHLAGIITWKSIDGGTNWVSTTEWTYPNTRGYTHCDVHALEYIGNKLFVGSDGGLSVSTDQGDNFQAISNGMGIRMFYRLGCAKTNSIVIAVGAQDNGGSVRTATGWKDWIGADGMETAVDHTNANIIYGSSQNGSFYKTTNGGTSYSGLTTPSTAGNWTTPFVIDPNVNTTLYVGYAELHKSTNSGGNWTQISSINIGKLNYITVAPSNSNYIYISSGNKIYRTTDGGTTWTNIATGLGSATINGIAVHSSSPNKVAVAVSGNQIYTSTNGGTAWTNSTGNFPAVSARCIVYQNDASEALYVGTNTGVYYKDNTMANWISFAAGLPIVPVNELEIHYASNKIRVATYGRGVWESDICLTTSAAPSANFAASSSSICTGTPVTFNDQSINSPTSWAWSFPGGTPSSSTVQNPSITYAAGGTYTVTLQSANANGTSTPVTKTITINITPTVAVNNATICSGNATTLSASGATTYNWSTGANTSSVSVSPSTTTNYTVTGTANGCINTKTVSVTVKATPTVAVSNATICSGNSASLSGSGATTYSWNTGATTSSISVTPTLTTNYTVSGTTNGCTNTKTVSVTVKATPTVAVNSATVCSGIPATLSAGGATTYSWNTGATTSSISVTPTVATNYTVTGTTNGCTNTKTVSVSVNASPTVAVSNATICSGNAASLSASGATTYNWNTGATTSSISVTPTVATNYTVTGTTNGCSNTKTVSVTVKATPTVAVNSATVCSGNPVTLTASGATTYNWNTGATTSSISVTPTVATNYTVTGTINGCTNTKTVSVAVNASPTVAVSNATICSGNAASLSASGATTYNWNTGATTSSISVTPTVATNYTVTGTTNGCSNTKTVSVTVKATPTVAVNSATVCSGNPVTLTASGATTYNWNTGATTSSISVTPTVATNYTVTGTINGCTNTKTVSVAVNASPTVAVSNATICSGNAATLSAGGATTYNWNTGATTSSISVTPTVATNYTVTGTTNGCTNTKTVSVTVNPKPSVTMGSITSPLCVNSAPVTLSGTPSGGVFSGSGVSGSSFNPATSGAGTFTISYNYTDVNNCSNFSNQSVIVSLCTGILELNGSFASVFPNPVKNEITINLDNDLINSSTFELFDAIGKLVMSEKMDSKTNTFQVSHLAQGMYILRISSKKYQKQMTIIKE